MQERIKKHGYDIWLARTKTSAVSGHTHETGYCSLLNEVKFIDQDLHSCTHNQREGERETEIYKMSQDFCRKLWDVASLLGAVAILPVPSCYRNWSHISQHKLPGNLTSSSLTGYWELKQTTMATAVRISPNKRINAQNNGYTYGLKIFIYISWLSSVTQQCEMTRFCIFWRTWRTMDK